MNADFPHFTPGMHTEADLHKASSLVVYRTEQEEIKFFICSNRGYSDMVFFIVQLYAEFPP